MAPTPSAVKVVSSRPLIDIPIVLMPGWGPRVSVRSALPVASVVVCSTVNLPLSFPSPKITVKVTGALGIGLPYWSRTSTIKGRASDVPGRPFWLLPEIISRPAGASSNPMSPTTLQNRPSPRMPKWRRRKKTTLS